ncbi:MAG: hypothetical protein IT377_02995 [Polyangiaceae bacterium]|nr:hypothetical protein [Polyangiaceae bacterium]
MTLPNEKKAPESDDSEKSRRRSGTRRVETVDPVSIPRSPRVPALGWPPRADQDQIPTQPENEVPSVGECPTLPAPPAAPPRPLVDVQMPEDDIDRDTIPSPAPHE